MNHERNVTIVLTGGGSGGHITPVLAVAQGIKRAHPQAKTVYIGQVGDSLSDVILGHSSIDHSFQIQAGKLRRYHGAGWAQIFDVKTGLLNIRDFFRTLRGFGESYTLLRRIQPDVVFVKGGFVGVPVGLAAALLRIPYITHDSDAIPGLANRIIARWAHTHAVALPEKLYQYPLPKTITVGVPVSQDYTYVTPKLQRAGRSHIKVVDDAQVVLVAGGGLGAQRVNDAVCAIAPRILHENPHVIILHQAGRAHVAAVEAAYNNALTPDEYARVRVLGFVPDMYQYSAAADIVIARAGGTNLAELAIQAKPCIVVPNPYLTGGHQLKNAQALAADGAILVVSEDQLSSGALYESLHRLLHSAQERIQFAQRLHAYAAPDASDKLARLLLQVATHTDC